MTDFLNSHDSDFLPITDARARPGRDTRARRSSHEYLAVSVRHIVVGVELESLGTFDESGEPPSETQFVVSSPPPA